MFVVEKIMLCFETLLQTLLSKYCHTTFTHRCLNYALRVKSYEVRREKNKLWDIIQYDKPIFVTTLTEHFRKLFAIITFDLQANIHKLLESKTSATKLQSNIFTSVYVHVYYSMLENAILKATQCRENTEMDRKVSEKLEGCLSGARTNFAPLHRSFALMYSSNISARVLRMRTISKLHAQKFISASLVHALLPLMSTRTQ